MKKILSMLVVLVFIITSFAMISVSAANATTGEIWLYTTEKENTVEAEIRVKGATDNLSNFTLYLATETANVALDTATATTIYQSKMTGWTAIAPFNAVGFGSAKAVKLSYAAKEADLSDTFAVADGAELPIFKFVFTKLTSSVTASTIQWGSLKTGPATSAVAYSTVSTTTGNSYSNASLGTPLKFKSLFTPYQAPVVNRTVTFKAEGFADQTRIVENGKALTDIPTVPVKTGHTGVWSTTSFPSVTSDLTVNAIYTPIEYTITFIAEGSADIIKKANYGTALADVPAVPAKSGFTGVWDTTDFTNITGNMTVTAIYTAIPPTVNTITANITGNGKVYIDTDAYVGKVTLAEGVSTAAIKIVPNLGYKVETATLTDGSTGNIVGATGGSYDASGLSGDETLVVTFVPVAETIGDNKPLPCQKVFTENKNVGGVAKKANTTFAAAPTAGIVEAGIYLKKNGVDYTNYGGPYFKSNNTNANGQYGIEFVGFESGTYTATPYVRYTSATETPTLAGTSVTFVVE